MPDNDPTRAARIARASVVATAPVIDGKLDDVVWRDVEPLSGFVQRELREGEPISERTEIRIITDREALYVGAWLFDRDPAAIVPGEKVRDVTLTNSDYVGIILDTYLDRQNGFVFATTPVGVEDRKSTRLNSSHLVISYAVFCLKKKKQGEVVIVKRTQQQGAT